MSSRVDRRRAVDKPATVILTRGNDYCLVGRGDAIGEFVNKPRVAVISHVSYTRFPGKRPSESVRENKRAKTKLGMPAQIFAISRLNYPHDYDQPETFHTAAPRPFGALLRDEATHLAPEGPRKEGRQLDTQETARGVVLAKHVRPLFSTRQEVVLVQYYMKGS